MIGYYIDNQDIVEIISHLWKMIRLSSPKMRS